jgi:hypothetical protein
VASLDGVTTGAEGQATRYAPDGCPDVSVLADDKNIVAVYGDLRARFPRCAWTGGADAMASASNGDAAPGWRHTDFGAVRTCSP